MPVIRKVGRVVLKKSKGRSRIYSGVLENGKEIQVWKNRGASQWSGAGGNGPKLKSCQGKTMGVVVACLRRGKRK